MEKKLDLNELKIKYKEIQKKYLLPSFDELNKDFKIEKLSEIETDYLIREIRGQISEIMENFLRFVEAILNPINLPMYFFPFIKSLTSKEKEKLIDIHKKLAKLQFNSLKLIEYSEEKEANFINEAFNLWQQIKKDFEGIIKEAESKWETKPNKTNGEYFG